MHSFEQDHLNAINEWLLDLISFWENQNIKKGYIHWNPARFCIFIYSKIWCLHFKRLLMKKESNWTHRRKRKIFLLVFSYPHCSLGHFWADQSVENSQFIGRLQLPFFLLQKEEGQQKCWKLCLTKRGIFGPHTHVCNQNFQWWGHVIKIYLSTHLF